jgi:Tol biopolymer transport system component/DNA-binding SARP family transcriptional activator
MIRFTLLGSIALQRPDGTPVDALLRQPKRLALLAYLASPIPGTWHRRDILLTLFWPELDAAHARSALRNGLYVLRQALGEDAILTRGDEEVAVNPARLSTDLGDLHGALRAANPEAAFGCYAGPLLPGLFPADSEGFQEWLEVERARLAQEVARAGQAAAGTLETEGRLAEALVILGRVLDLAPDDEPVVRRLMALHGRLGDRAGVLAAYERFRVRLERDFGATPSAETEALAAALRREAPLPDVGPLLPGASTTSLPPGEQPSTPVALPSPVRRTRLAWPWVAGAVVLLLGIAALLRPRDLVPPAIGRSLPLTAEDGLQVQPALSPDGQLAAYVAGNGRRMQIHVRPLAGGPSWPLSSDTASVQLLPRWSPDGSSVLYLARNGAFVVQAAGGVPRLVAAGGEGPAMVRSASWTPGGDSILVVRHDSLLVVPLAGTGARFIGQGHEVHSCTWSTARPWIACVSGNWVAFTPGPLFGNRAPSAVVLFPASGGPPVEVTDREFEHLSPAWSADGSLLWVLSNRDGVPGDAYVISIGRDGRPTQPPVRTGLNAEAISLAGNRVAYSVPRRRANLWAVPIPTTGPFTLAAATQLTFGNQVIEVPHASADGRWVVFDSDQRGNADIYRMPAGGGAPERITDDPRPEFGASLSPDGTELAYHMWVDGERRLFIRQLADGTVTPVVPAPGHWQVPRWSPDGRALATWSIQTAPGAMAVVRRDGDGQWGAASWVLADAQLPVWSPDGRTIAFVRLRGSVELISADSGTVATIYSPRPEQGDPVATFLAWGRDGTTLWFLGHDPDGRDAIWALPARGGAPSRQVDFGEQTSGPAITTDGVRLFFTIEERLSNIRWATFTTR